MTDNMIEEPMTEQTIDETPALTIEDIEAALAAAMPEPEPHTPFTDATASWTYWTDMDSVEQGIPDEWVWERLRNRRDSLLAACDWRVVADAPWDTACWLAYRQALRDLPASTVDPRRAVWPFEP